SLVITCTPLSRLFPYTTLFRGGGMGGEWLFLVVVWGASMRPHGVVWGASMHPHVAHRCTPSLRVRAGGGLLVGALRTPTSSGFLGRCVRFCGGVLWGLGVHPCAPMGCA